MLIGLRGIPLFLQGDFILYLRAMKILLLVLLITCSITATAQTNDTTMIDRYCGLSIGQKGLSAKIIISLDFGEDVNIWKSNALKDEMTGKVKTFNSVIDAFNYMGSLGWKYVNSFNNTAQPNTMNTFIFKKEFKKE
jgi:hypothetical protein